MSIRNEGSSNKTASINHEQLLTRFGSVFTPEQGNDWLQKLIAETDWQYDYFAFGRRFSVPRLQSWHAEEGIYYRYSDNFLERKDWNASLLELKRIVEQQTQHPFNSVLMTYYRDGNDFVDWHADNESELGDQPYIASLTFGTGRQFQYRHNVDGSTFSITPAHGELLLMEPDFQHHWQHCVPLEQQISEPRINLTFRNVLKTRNQN